MDQEAAGQMSARCAACKSLFFFACHQDRVDVRVCEQKQVECQCDDRQGELSTFRWGPSLFSAVLLTVREFLVPSVCRRWRLEQGRERTAHGGQAAVACCVRQRAPSGGACR